MFISTLSFEEEVQNGGFANVGLEGKLICQAAIYDVLITQSNTPNAAHDE